MKWNILGFGIMMLVVLIIYHKLQKSDHPRTRLYAKMLCSTVFLTAGLVGTILITAQADLSARLFSMLVLTGGCLGWIGDLLLELADQKGQKMFIAGIVAFAVNHLLYLGALTWDGALTWFGILTTGLLFGAGLVCNRFWLRLDIPKALLLPGLFYDGIICLMVGCSLTRVWISGANWLTISFAVGSVLFFLSDVILVTGLFSRHKLPHWSAFNVATYFPGQLLCQLSLLALCLQPK